MLEWQRHTWLMRLLRYILFYTVSKIQIDGNDSEIDEFFFFSKWFRLVDHFIYVRGWYMGVVALFKGFLSKNIKTLDGQVIWCLLIIVVYLLFMFLPTIIAESGHGIIRHNKSHIGNDASSLQGLQWTIPKTYLTQMLKVAMTSSGTTFAPRLGGLNLCSKFKIYFFWELASRFDWL